MGTEQPNDLSGTENKTNTEETTVSFAKKTQEPPPQSEDTETKVKLDFFRQMEDAFSEEQLTTMLQITQGLMVKPEQLPVVYELVTSQVDAEKKAA